MPVLPLPFQDVEGTYLKYRGYSGDKSIEGIHPPERSIIMNNTKLEVRRGEFDAAVNEMNEALVQYQEAAVNVAEDVLAQKEVAKKFLKALFFPSAGFVGAAAGLVRAQANMLRYTGSQVVRIGGYLRAATEGIDAHRDAVGEPTTDHIEAMLEVPAMAAE